MRRSPGTHIGIFPISDRITHVDFHLVGSGRDIQNLRLIVERCRRPGLQAVYECDRTHRGTCHDDLRRIRRLRFPRSEPTAGRKADQYCQYADSQSLLHARQYNSTLSRSAGACSRPSAIRSTARFDEGEYVEFSSTHCQVLLPLCVGGESAIYPLLDRFNQRRMHMTHEILALRAAQALLAVTATVTSVLVLQFAMLAG